MYGAAQIILAVNGNNDQADKSTAQRTFVQPCIFDRKFTMIRRILASLLATIFFAGVVGALAGCNTIEGAGADIQKGGKAIQDEAREQKK